MNPRHAFAVFRAAFALGFKEIFAEKINFFGTFIIYTILVLSYGRIFKGIAEADLAAYGLTAQGMIWYFGATEFVVFLSTSILFKELQYEIQNGSVHMALLRPCPLWVVKLGEWTGQSFARVAILFVPCFAVTGLMAGSFGFLSFDSVGILLALPIAAVLSVACQFMIGSASLWLGGRADPVFWIWQKLLFLLGALMWPFALYPQIMKDIAHATPFPSMLAVPAGWLLSGEERSSLASLGQQSFWLVVFLVLASAVNKAMLSRTQRTGD